MVMKGTTPKIDPRYETSSFAEGQLVEVIRRCWTYDPEIRPNMTEVQSMLKDAILENEKLQEAVSGPLPP